MTPQTTDPPSQELTVDRRAELLARAPSDVLVELAERCIAGGEGPTVIRPPEVGMVMLTVREPIARERFHLGEVLVTRAEVELGGHRGWSMRLGDDRLAALAAAVLDAEAAADRALASEVDEVCRLVERMEADRAAEEWAELAPTQVSFDEID